MDIISKASPLGYGLFISPPDVSHQATNIESVPDYNCSICFDRIVHEIDRIIIKIINKRIFISKKT